MERCNLEVIPHFTMKLLEYLGLAGNKLVVIPHEIGILYPNLKKLDLQRNSYDFFFLFVINVFYS